MTKKMLIDATHSEETRVAVMDGDKLVEFDYESQFRKPIKGSIFLAKVTRVEPSLQAAFVNFGGNRHGFLPFSEIHPDYFRIPVEDREALMAEQEELVRKHEEALAREEEEDKKGKNDDKDMDSEESSEDLSDDQDDEEHVGEDGDDIGNKIEDDEDATDDDIGNRKDSGGRGGRGGRGRGRNNSRGGRDNNRNGGGRGGKSRNFRGKRTEKYGDENFDPEERFRFSLRRKYKIQEVIKRGQIVLVQASKEERGNKGAAFTSYLSLPGRYCVLMPNSPRGGGVSRKIANYKDRNKMRELLKELAVPKGMSVILRTAGVERTKAEVKRDLDYLMRLWNNIRELTLESSAPAIVYEEANLIKRAIRDLYARDIDEIHVSGQGGYDSAKDFMKMMIPSHVKKVKQYDNEKLPLFNKYKAESQIADIGKVEVTLPSGGYLVINPTEALVSVDVNSGRSTKERHIEETALKTNLEAAVEVCRQLRLRDLGGLVVIDFIDMEDRRNNGKVERKMRDALSTDRARVQNGRISSFGLMELSRQRLNPSLTESQYETCGHCLGLGRVRSADATSIMVLRAIEDEGMKARAAQVIVHVPSVVALYMLNSKRKHLGVIEERYGFEVVIRVDDSAAASAFRIEVSKPSGSKAGSKDNGGDQDDEKPSEGQKRRGRRGGRGRSSNRNQDDNRSNQANKSDTQKSDDAPDKPVAAKKDESEKKVEDSASDVDEKPKARRVAAKSETDEKKAPVKKKAPAKKETANDDKPKKAPAKTKAKPKSKAKDEPNPAADHEVVNEKPKQKKKGWWSL